MSWILHRDKPYRSHDPSARAVRSHGSVIVLSTSRSNRIKSLHHKRARAKHLSVVQNSIPSLFHFLQPLSPLSTDQTPIIVVNSVTAAFTPMMPFTTISSNVRTHKKVRIDGFVKLACQFAIRLKFAEGFAKDTSTCLRNIWR